MDILLAGNAGFHAKHCAILAGEGRRPHLANAVRGARDNGPGALLGAIARQVGRGQKVRPDPAKHGQRDQGQRDGASVRQNLGRMRMRNVSEMKK